MGEILFPFDLLEAFDPRRGSGVVAVVGSGPSCHAGMPSWPELLRRIAVEVGLEAQVETYLQKGEFLKVAEFMARQRSQSEIKERVAKQIERSELGPSPLHQLIVNLPFAGIITTNYDLLLTQADLTRRFASPITYLNSSLRSKLSERFILHLHGHMGDPESIIISRQGYDYMELEAEKVRQFLAGVFQFRTVLFIGFGFADHHIDDLLRELKVTGAIGESTVFALIPFIGSTDPVLHDNLRYRSINPIYVEDIGDHGVKRLLEWLETLKKVLDQIDSSQQRSVKQLKPKYVFDRIVGVLASDIWLPLFEGALSALPNRPDLQHSVRLKLKPVDVTRILENLGLEEMRIVLMRINRIKRNEVIEDALTCFPPPKGHETEASVS